jgi:hypothetical protein
LWSVVGGLFRGQRTEDRGQSGPPWRACVVGSRWSVAHVTRFNSSPSGQRTEDGCRSDNPVRHECFTRHRRVFGDPMSDKVVRPTIRCQDPPRGCISNCGCRGIIPLPGCLRGSAPQGLGFDFVFQTPLRGHKGEHKKLPLRRSGRDTRSPLGRWGGTGAAPPAAARMRRLGHQSSPTRRRSRHLFGLRSVLRCQRTEDRAAAGAGLCGR